MSLSRHLTSPSATHGRLAFHPECPRCRNERLNGQLASDRLVALRTQAALAAGLLAFSAGATPAAAFASSPSQEQEGATDPAPEAPGLEPEFDPGADHQFDAEISAPPSAEGGGQEDEGDGPPVETEPLSDPDADQVDPDAPPQPEPLPAPPSEPPPTVPPATPPATPAPTPVEPPVAVPLQAPEPPAAETHPSPPETDHQSKGRTGYKPGPASKPPPTPAPAPAANPAPVTVADEPAAVAPTDTVAVSQRGIAAGDSVEGAGYRVREGDSLWSIAARRLGPEASAGQIARQVNRLWELNSDRIGTGNPSLIHVGTMLRLR